MGAGPTRGTQSALRDTGGKAERQARLSAGVGPVAWVETGRHQLAAAVLWPHRDIQSGGPGGG